MQTLRLFFKALRLLAFLASFFMLLACACAAWLPPFWWTECLLAFTLQGGLILLGCAFLVFASSMLVARLGIGSLILVVVNIAAAVPILVFVENQAPWLPSSNTINTITHRKKALPQGTPMVRFIQHNVLKARKNYDAVVALLRREDADIIALEEIDKPGFVRLRHDKILSKKYPSFAGGWQSGQCLLSRWPIQDSRTIIRYHLPILFTKIHTPEGLNLTVLVIHPPHPTSPRYGIAQKGVLNEIKVLQDQQMLNQPLIVAGDFNDTPYNVSYRTFLKEVNLVDPQKKFGLLPSWPSFLPPVLRIPIDHVLHSPDLQVSEHHFVRGTGSDHLPLYIVLYQSKLH